ncbi:transmembrane protein 132E [Biomphalaria glabrata]|nr:transmembrane protein 132E [Biomphalaria glabrata]
MPTMGMSMTPTTRTRRSYYTFILSVCFSLFVDSVLCINIDFDDSNDGFFLKSSYKFKPAEPNVVRESLILTHPAEVYKLRASYGPFEMYEVVPNEILNSLTKSGDIFETFSDDMHRHVMHNLDVSAHLVSQTIVPAQPWIQVLIHVQTLSRKQKQDMIYHYYGITQRWCAQVFVSRGSETHTAVCLLDGDQSACVASLPVPEHWWDTSNLTLFEQDIRVEYDLSRVEQSQECASVSNTIVPSRAEVQSDNPDKKYLASVHLLQEQVVYADHKDKDLVFRVPQMDLQANTRFEVPVFLDKNSVLKEFAIQMRVRGNIVMEGAAPSRDSPWIVSVNSSSKDGSIIVAVSYKENGRNAKIVSTSSVYEIMRYKFRTLSTTSSSSSARIIWSVNYEKNGLSRNPYFGSETSRITAKFNVIGGRTEKVIVVMKERNLLNTAILTGTPVSHDMMVYSLSSNNTLREITKDCSCRSTDPEALQVSHSCDVVFMDGSETRGAKNVTLLVRTGDHVSQIGVRVWIPEPRLDIQLSDSKLSQIRGWRVPYTQPKSKRSADGSNLGLSNVTVIDRERSEPHSCESKYQQTMIDVYARFSISAPGESTFYYRNKKVFIRVTDLVKDRLKVANPNIARIVGNTVQGVSPGLTEVQVISPTGKLLGAKEIKVAKDKVAIERLLVRVISGMGLRISEDPNLPGALLATVTLRDQLVAKQQEAVLDIAVEFKDGSMLPLAQVPAEEYELEVTSMNTDVVEVTEALPPIPAMPPSIKAIGNGKGEIVRVTLREIEMCSKKTIRSLDSEYVHVQVDFTKDLDFFNLVQSDSNYYHRSNEKRPLNNEQERYSHKDDYFKHQQKMSKKHELEEDSNYYKSSKSGPKVFPVVDDLEKLESYTASDDSDDATKEPKSEALEQPVSTKAKHPSPLEIGMYVLVAVFVFAILVFTANCAVFMVRYQRKRFPKNSRVMTGSISQAPDWVWIGRATLERSGAGSAGCNHALMAEEDFNGNQMVVPNALPAERQRQSQRRPVSGDLNVSNTTSGVTGSSESNRSSLVSTYKGSECSIRITSNPLPDNDCGMGYNEAEWDYEAMGMTYEQLMEYFDNLKESSA